MPGSLYQIARNRVSNGVDLEWFLLTGPGGVTPGRAYNFELKPEARMLYGVWDLGVLGAMGLSLASLLIIFLWMGVSKKRTRYVCLILRVDGAESVAG